ncbi:MAG TPA: DUF5777 family beta-barrel protein [Chitinophagaceae bacterium]|jgi:hypothetical protein|nr:DUF5777 family beta-barrel protein [Chitinophagaceae bacterium]HMU57999.1 DUF5777 family beta-barrel protein [Chitinophagaceae bacterium]
MKKIIILLVLGLSAWTVSVAQDETPANEAPKQKFTRATFNSTKLINNQTTEIVSKGNLQFLISHHFSPLWIEDASRQDNWAQLFGLNSGLAYTYLSFDYSPTDYANVGLAAAGKKRYEGWAKFKLLRQQTGKKNVPVTLGTYSLFSVNAGKDASVQLGWNKWSFMHQLLIARKFNDKFSLQLAPTLVYFNEVPYGINNSNFVGSLTLGGKYKLTSNKNLTFEYSRQLNMYKNLIDKNGTIIDYKPDLFSVGMEFNTGGHLFQFYIGNTTYSSQIDQLARNTSTLDFHNLALGFTINRSLSLKKD